MKKRQTMSANDVLKALNDLDFHQFVNPVEECLQKGKSVKKSVKTSSHPHTNTNDDVTEQDVAMKEVEEPEDEEGTIKDA
jgi:hypothetical protein